MPDLISDANDLENLIVTDDQDEEADVADEFLEPIIDQFDLQDDALINDADSILVTDQDGEEQPTVDSNTD